MTLSPERDAAGRELVLKFHKGAELADVEAIAEPIPKSERPDFMFLMLEMSNAATEVLHGRTTRENCIEKFMGHGDSREKAETYFDLAFETLSKHTQKSASSDGALAARNNPLLASKVATLANRQGRAIRRLSLLNRTCSILIPIALFAVLIFHLHLAWWMALVIAVIATVVLLTIGMLFSGMVTARYAKEFLNVWPRRDTDFPVAVAILDCLDGVPLKDELVAKINKSEMDRINQALKRRR